MAKTNSHHSQSGYQKLGRFCGNLTVSAILFGSAIAQTPQSVPAPMIKQASPPQIQGSERTATEPAAIAAEPKILEVNNAAKVALVEGEVTVIADKNQRRKVKVGDMLVEGESIVTGKDGELHLDMEDGGYMAIRPNTKMRIVKYQAKGNESDIGLFGLLQGSFRSVTGWIGRFNRAKYTVRTPSAIIGIRGTDHEPLVIPAGSSEGEAGTYDKVNAGGSVITTPQGRVEVTLNQAGFAAHGAKAAPRMLKEIPGFFRGTRNERLLDGKHDTIQQRIVQRRESRRQEIMKRAGAKKALPAERAAIKTAKREEAKQARADAIVARQKAKQEAAEKKAAQEKEKQEQKREQEKKDKQHVGHHPKSG